MTRNQALATDKNLVLLARIKTKGTKSEPQRNLFICLNEATTNIKILFFKTKYVLTKTPAHKLFPYFNENIGKLFALLLKKKKTTSIMEVLNKRRHKIFQLE